MDPTGAEKAHDHDDDSGVCVHVNICVYVHDHMCTHAYGDRGQCQMPSYPALFTYC